jgi:two-component system response regulator PilR (NtrC family)
MSKILIADDSKELRDALSKLLTKQGYEVESVSDGLAAVEKIGQNFYDLLLTDVRMPKLDGLEVLKRTKAASPATIVIVITAFGTVNNAVEAMRRGAFDYVLKPFSQKEIEIKVKKALDSRMVGVENTILKEQVDAGFDRIIGNCDEMKDVYLLIKKVAPTNAPVLIIGETGTGKELVARKIHQESDRAKGPFVAVNCMALASGVLESELFGHEKGSFTGAATGDTVACTPAPTAGGITTLDLSWNCYVSAANTVQIRACNPTTGAENPSSQTWRVDVWQH